MASCMTYFDLLVVIAILLSPIIALKVDAYSSHKRTKEKRKVDVFEILMATRGDTLATEHVRALNMIALVFSVKDQTDKEVLSAWKEYHHHLCDRDYLPAGWRKRREELLMELLIKMAGALGYNYDNADIRLSYNPEVYAQIVSQKEQIRKGLIDVINGNAPISINVRENE